MMWSLHHVTETYKVYFCPDRREGFNIPSPIKNPIAFNSSHHSISSRTLAVILQFLATGSSKLWLHRHMEYLSHWSPDVSYGNRCIVLLCCRIYCISKESEQLINQQRFYERSGFPLVIGYALGCFKKPGIS